MSTRQSAIIQQFTDSRAEVVAASRFFANERVSLEALAQATRDACHAACQRHAAARRAQQAASGEAASGEAAPGETAPEVHVLAIQDTTEINVEAHRGRLRTGEDEAPDPHLGPVGNGHDAGFFLHPTLALDARSGLPLGFADVHLWNRPWDAPDKHARNYRQLPIEHKESGRWLRASEQAKATLVPALTAADRVTIIADREGDIYAELATIPETGAEAGAEAGPRARVDVLIRSRGDRRIVPGARTPEAPPSEAPRTLYAALAAQPVCMTYAVRVPSTNGRQARTAQIELRYAAVSIRKPRSNHQGASLPETVALWAVEACETAGPGGTVPEGEAPIRWRLLTSRPARSATEAREVVRLYALRWRIEQVFRLLKSQGLEVPRSQLTRGAALKRLTTLALQVALTLMQLVEGRDGEAGEEGAEVVFSASAVAYMRRRAETLSGRTAKQRCPHAAGTLAWGSWVVGRLGGWKGYARADPPGPITMHRGLARLHQELAGWELARSP
jgi:hypothetical protein